MTRDLYADAQVLDNDMGEAGYPEWDRRIDDAIAAGATSTEILMALRWTLSELLAHEAALDEPLRERVSWLAEEIGRVLR